MLGFVSNETLSVALVKPFARCRVTGLRKRQAHGVNPHH